MKDNEIAKHFGSMGGKARSKRLSKEEKVSSARRAAILRWYPSVSTYEVMRGNPAAKKKYLRDMREQREREMMEKVINEQFAKNRINTPGLMTARDALIQAAIKHKNQNRQSR